MLGSKTKRAIEGGEPVKEHLLITRYNPSRVEDGQMLRLEDIQDILRIKLIGVIPESEVVLQSSNQGTPAIHAQGSDVSEAYKDVIDRFLGQEKPLRFIEAEKPGFFQTPVREQISHGFLPPFSSVRRKTASVAKERLQIILAHERNGRSAAEPDYLPALQRELVAVISKYVKINPEDLKVQLERQDNLEVLEVKIELPDTVR